MRAISIYWSGYRETGSILNGVGTIVNQTKSLAHDAYIPMWNACNNDNNQKKKIRSML